jgi:hypothetical protein
MMRSIDRPSLPNRNKESPLLFRKGKKHYWGEKGKNYGFFTTNEEEDMEKRRRHHFRRIRSEMKEEY